MKKKVITSIINNSKILFYKSYIVKETLNELIKENNLDQARELLLESEKMMVNEKRDNALNCVHPLWMEESTKENINGGLLYNCRCVACEKFMLAYYQEEYSYKTHFIAPLGQYKTFGGPIMAYPSCYDEDDYFNTIRTHFLLFMNNHAHDDLEDYQLAEIFVLEFRLRPFTESELGLLNVLQKELYKQAYQELSHHPVFANNNDLKKVEKVLTIS